jgi:hypothetical protein
MEMQSLKPSAQRLEPAQSGDIGNKTVRRHR